MTLVSNDPIWWPFINAYRTSRYFYVAACAGLMYDCALTFGQEIELVWRQRWSLMTALYLSARYLGISYAVVNILVNVPIILLTDSVCHIMLLARNWVGFIVNGILGVIVLARLHAMYQHSRTILIFLAVSSLAVIITNGVLGTLSTRGSVAEALILSGTYQCTIDLGRGANFLAIAWILGTVWQVITLCLALWIAVKHFRELRRQSARGNIGDLFTVLIKSHVVYFASIVAVSCFAISGFLSPTLLRDIYSLETQIYYGLLQIFQIVQMFVLGPRLILSIRECHAKLVAHSDSATAMTSIVFEEHVHVSTSNSV